MEFGYFSLCLAARGQRVQCWNQPVQRSVHELQGAELPNAFGLQGRHGAVATAPGALPRAGREAQQLHFGKSHQAQVEVTT